LVWGAVQETEPPLFQFARKGMRIKEIRWANPLGNAAKQPDFLNFAMAAMMLL
jgi:hypothetical protein